MAQGRWRIMADTDYDREISPRGERERHRQRKKEREQGKQDLEINVVPLALAIRNDRLVREWLL